METSVIVRVKNEKENLQKLFIILKDQTYQDFELVIVNNNSIDGSEKIVFDYFSKNRIQVILIKDFSYSKACNLGAEKAKGKYLVFLSAHSFPVSKTWLMDGLSNFKSDKVAGVFAFPVAGEESTLAEKIIGFPNKYKKGGHLGNTNSIIRLDLWEKHKFDESLIVSEDLEWSMYFKRKGYEIINDPRFRVTHSHHLGLLGIIKKHLIWQNSKKEIRNKFQN
ncbi:MAG: glycosyltransferase family 2 protein [Candidatus Levybacteria bacterium]|nr:glycosyltransferase family 2 protein [Candidatus Levybacteria bacterium]